jgi:hypothetical protein
MSHSHSSLPFGKTPPKTFLAEPWKAVTAAQSIGIPAEYLGKYIIEIRHYPGDPVDDESYNPVIGKSAAICFPTSPDLSFLGPIESHFLRWSDLRLVKSSPAELERIGTTYFVQGAEEVIKAENKSPVIAGEAAAIAGLGALVWFHHRRHKVAEAENKKSRGLGKGI